MLASVTKSYTGALVGLALEQGVIESIDQPTMDYFPELVNQITNQRKFDITIHHLLQMHAGYPWEESSPELFNILWREGFRPDHLASIPLIRDPGNDHE